MSERILCSNWSNYSHIRIHQIKSNSKQWCRGHLRPRTTNNIFCYGNRLFSCFAEKRLTRYTWNNWQAATRSNFSNYQDVYFPIEFIVSLFMLLILIHERICSLINTTQEEGIRLSTFLKDTTNKLSFVFTLAYTLYCPPLFWTRDLELNSRFSASETN